MQEYSLKSLVAQAKLSEVEITVEEAVGRLAGNTARILDVREPAEYLMGTIRNALHIPRGMLEAKADKEYPGRDPALQDREQELLVICKSGSRSLLAAASLRLMGFSNIVSVAGGYDAWLKAGLPVHRPAECCY